MPVIARDHAARLLEDGHHAARAAGLHWVDTTAPGLSRRKHGKGFGYADADGRRVTDRATLSRIRALAIPPAWVDVWICVDPLGHVQACGRDARGRKQARYHARWREVRDRAKHDHVRHLGRVLPRLRDAVERDLACECLCRDAVLAAVVMLMDRGRLRVGNDEYARANGSRGACTLEDDDVRIRGGRVVCFDFVAKSGVRQVLEIEHPRLAAVVRRCRAVPGPRLFQYPTDQGNRWVSARDVNAYIRDRTGGRFTAKDLRTWHASRLCARLLGRRSPRIAERDRRRAVTDAVKQVAAQLGNTPTVCRNSYIDPQVIDGFLRAA